MEHEFDDYLKNKKIDPEAFKATETETYKDFRDQFLQLHPDSFTMQKLFFINVLRRKYHYVKTEDVKKEISSPRPRPVMTRTAKKESDESSHKPSKPVVKPKMPKPVTGVKKSEDDVETKKSPKQRPVIRPKISSAKKSRAEAAGKPNDAKPKPVFKRPVVKPNTNDKTDGQQDSQEKSDGGKTIKKTNSEAKDTKI